MKEISAGIIVYRKTSEGVKFLILYHGRDYWNFPKGKIESEEKSWQAAVREVREETGLGLADLKFRRQFRAYEKFFFRRQRDNIFKVVIFYLAKTKNSTIRISKEHEGYGWFTYGEALKILSKYKESQRLLKKVYRFIQSRAG